MGCYLVTGAAGFIGSCLARRLLALGHEVVSIDNLTTGYLHNVPAAVKFYQGDCQDKTIYEKIPSIAYDAIFHLAGQSSGEISFDDPVYDLRTNTESTLHLLQFALKVNCQRFIYASSMSVYGVGSDLPITETTSTYPQSFYAIGKLASERYLDLYQRHGIQSTVLRFFTVYGPSQNLSNLRQGMISIYMAQMLTKHHIQVHGDGKRFRDFVYIEDVIDACVNCLSHTDTHGKIINIGSGKKTTVESLLKQLVCLYEKPIVIEYLNKVTQGDIWGIYADITLAKNILHFEPRYSLESGLKLMLQWARTTQLVT